MVPRAVRGCRGRAKSIWAQGGHQPVGVEGGFGFEHEIDGAGQLDGQDGVGLELVAQPRFQALRQRPDDHRIAFGNHRRFAEGPAQIGIAQLGPAQALDLARTGHGALDQPAVGQEIFDGGEAGDVADLVEEGQAEVIANARRGLQQGEIAAGRLFGELEQVLFQAGQLRVVMADHGQVVLQGELADGIRFRGQELFGPGLAVVQVLAAGRTVMGQLMGLDAGKQFAAIPDIENPLAQERPQRTLGGGINVAGRDEIGAQQVGEFFGVNAVVLVFTAVNGFNVKRVGEHEVQARRLARIGQPIPAEHAFGADGQVVAIRRDEFEEELEVVVADVGVDEFFAVPVHDADVHLPGMEVDSAVELGGRGVVFHRCVVLHG